MNSNFTKPRGIAKASTALLLLLTGGSSWAAGDLANGKLQYEQKCSGCHAIDAHRAGPAHRGIFGRKAGSAAGFSYSTALKNSSVIWNEKTLEAWLSEPERLIPGQAMYFQVNDAASRRDIIAYLATHKPNGK